MLRVIFTYIILTLILIFIVGGHTTCSPTAPHASIIRELAYSPTARQPVQPRHPHISFSLSLARIEPALIVNNAPLLEQRALG